MNEPRISVIIPVKNEAARIEQCLEAVFSQSLKPYEVLIVDGHSTDGTVERAQKFPVKVFYEDGQSIALGRQVGVENAQGEYIAFTDADCVPDKQWLANLLKEFGAEIVGVGGGIKNMGDGLWEKSINLAIATFIGGANTIQGRFFKGRRFVSSISACNSLYRKGDILAIGGFDRNLAGGEELELNRRFSRVGKLIYTPEAIVKHYHGWTLGKFARKMFRYGKERGIIRAWNIQFIPAIAAPLLVLSLAFTPWIFISLISLYLLLLVMTGTRFAIQENNLKYILSVPVVYLIEHVTYSLGIWKGLIFGK
jgi:glycosyltransferase involved in cell wall biosynthesis